MLESVAERSVMKVLCAQIGARRNYEMPWQLHQTQQLSLLVTDFWNPLGDTFKVGEAWLPVVVRGAQARFRRGIPSRKVRTYLRMAFSDLIHREEQGAARGERFARLSVKFARFTAKCADRVDHDSMFAFCGAALEGLEKAKALGYASLLDQYDTGQELEQTIEEEALRFRKLNQQVTKLPGWYYERMREEWRLADTVVVNSSWTRQALLRSGIPIEKIAVVPSWIPDYAAEAVPRRRKTGNLRVLWFGRFCLGKGLVYAIEAARQARHLPIDFAFVGKSCVDLNAIDWPENCSVTPGHVHRKEVARIYASHDVLLFPTLSDNFGGVQLEAMAQGLPVIATPCCGEAVEHGKSGFIVPPRDARSIVGALEELLDPGRLEAMSAAAYARVDAFSHKKIIPQYIRALRPDGRPTLAAKGRDRE